MTKTELKNYSISWYQPGSRIKLIFWYLVNALFFLNPFCPISSLKIWLLRLFGAKIGQGVVLKPRINIKYPWLLEVGDFSWIGEGVWIDNLAIVKIGNNVCLSQGCMLLCGNHDYKKSTFNLMVRPITLEDGVWIGAQSVVCPGVKCGSHSVLSVKSVANKNLLAYTVYQGNPAKAIKNRDII